MRTLRNRSRRFGARTGLTVLEMMLGVGMLTIISGTILESLVRFQEAGSAVGQEYTLTRRASQAAMRLTEDLARTGFHSDVGVQYPMVLPSGGAAEIAPGFRHDPIDETDGASQELVFRLPVDADDDGWPDYNGSTPAWDDDRIAYYLRPTSNGRSELVRDPENGRLEVLCRGVVRLQIESPVDTGYTIPLDAIRITMTLSAEDDGQLFEEQIQEVIRLKNGGLAP